MVPMDGQGDSSIGFWSMRVPAGKKATHRVVSSPFHFELVHATTVALGENARDGAHVIKIDTADQQAVICTLDKKLGYQAEVDFAFGIDATFHNSGPTDVYLTGYRTISVADDGDDEYEDDEDEEISSEEEEDDEEAPEGVPIGGKALKQEVMRRLMQQQPDGDEDEDEDEDDEDFDSNDEVEDESEDEEESSEQEEQEQQRGAAAKLAAKSFPGAGDSDDGELPPLGSDDIIGEVASDDEMEDADEDEDESEEGSEEEEPQAPQAKPSKRPAPATPQPAAAKKPKLDAAPATAPAKVQQQSKAAGTPAGGNSAAEKEYEAALIKFLQAEGAAVKLAALGSKVKRPAGVPKMKPFLTSRSSVFKLDEQNDTISLA